MKSIKEIFADSSPKNIDKLTKAFNKGGSSNYMNQVISEAGLSDAYDFSASKILVTSNFICAYSDYGAVLGGPIVVIPIDLIANLYRSNISTNDNSYNYDFFYLILETKNGHKYNISTAPRNKANFQTLFSQEISYIRNKISNKEAI